MAMRGANTPRTAIIILLLAFGVISAHSQHTLSSIDILSQPNCDVGAALVPNMQDCVIDELMGSNGTLTFSFNVEAKAKHSVLLTLRSVGGAAVMRLYNSKNDVLTGQVVYFNDAVTESFVRLAASDVVGGQYTLVVQGMGGATQKILLYLRVQTPPAGAKLAKEDKTAMLSILRECCPPGNNPMAPDVCSSFLPAALNAQKPEDDLCNVGDFVCDEDGHLQKIDFSNAGLTCKQFPEAFGKFPALETLMLRYNDFGGDTLDHVAEVLSGTTTLRRLMMGATNVTGTVPCSLFEDHKLRTIMFSINKLEGTLPECVLASTTLEELYMSRVTLTGPLPDSIPTDSNLRVWYAINRDPVTGEEPGPGFTGEIPPSISNAAGLAFVELSNHQLTGGVPALPAGIRMFEVQSNQLDGGIASPLPQSLVYLDAMNNSLTGPIPDFSESKELTLLDLSSNSLTGNLPDTFGAAGDSLVYMDMSENDLQGPVNPGTLWERVPQLQYCFLQNNTLEGPVPASLAASTQLVALNLAENNLSGDLKAFAGAINPPRATSPQTSGRKLSQQAQGHHCHHHASAMVAKKLFGSYEEFTAPNPAGWQLDVRNIADLATHKFADARRRLQQLQTPAAGGAATAPVTPPEAPAAAAVPAAATAAVPAAATAAKPAVAPTLPAAQPAAPPQVAEEAVPENVPAAAAAAAPKEPEAEVPAAGGATTTMVGPDAAAAAAEPAAPEQDTPPVLPQEQEPSAPAPEVPDSAMQNAPDNPAAAASAQQNDIGVVQIPSMSALAGNSFLYLNISNNMLTGPVPEELGNLEMFRSPANSTDPYDMYVYSRGGPDRTLDLTNNELYGEFPLFLIDQPTDLSDSCLCQTTFNVSDGNFLFCPTKGTLGAMQTTKAEIQLLTRANYTCMLPGKKERVSLAQYLSKPAGWITEIPPASEVVVERSPKAATTSRSSSSYPTAASSGSSSSGSGVGPGAIAGIVIGVLAALAILGSLAYFVGYKKFWTEHKATSFKRGQIPDGPAFDGAAAYPAAAYGAADIETPAPAPR